jgi:threonine dehydrogenase-like Zn-dependent dehydrogenase
METAVNAMWDAAPRVGDRIAVVGGGVVGCLVAALCARLPGVSVELVDVDPARADIAARLGVGFALPDGAAGDCDLVVHASGAPAGLTTALGLAGFEATVLEMSWYGDQMVSAPLGEAFHSRRLTLRASQVGHVAPSRRARHSRRDRLILALSLLCDPVFDCLLTGRSAFDDLPATMARLAGAPDGTLCHVVVYS